MEVRFRARSAANRDQFKEHQLRLSTAIFQGKWKQKGGLPPLACSDYSCSWASLLNWRGRISFTDPWPQGEKTRCSYHKQNSEKCVSSWHVTRYIVQCLFVYPVTPLWSSLVTKITYQAIPHNFSLNCKSFLTCKWKLSWQHPETMVHLNAQLWMSDSFNFDLESGWWFAKVHVNISTLRSSEISSTYKGTNTKNVYIYYMFQYTVPEKSALLLETNQIGKSVIHLIHLHTLGRRPFGDLP